MELGLGYVILCVILTDDTSGYGGDATRTSLQHVKL